MTIKIAINSLEWNIKIFLPDKKSLSFFCNVFSCYDLSFSSDKDNADCIVELCNDPMKYNLKFTKNNTYFEKRSIEEIYVAICVYLFNLKNYYNENCWILHGAAFIYKKQTCLIIGPTHSGKSTLITQLISQKGVKYITDDSIVFDKKTLSIIPFPKPINLRDVDCVYDFINHNHIYKANNKLLKTYVYNPTNAIFLDKINCININIFVLNRKKEIRNISIQDIGNVEQFLEILLNSFRTQFSENYNIASKLLNQTQSMFKVNYRNKTEALELVFSKLDTTGLRQ
ncbi:MAG: hypothetical protein E7388_06840 [Ruminococcaceae bacterium]|nr:hypothetical protein [Oscillospiraceae bacterium]